MNITTINIPSYINKIVAIFPEDCELNLVGGCVRDSFLGLEPKDYDLVTNLQPDQIESLLKANNIPCDSIGKAFGIIFATIEGYCVEIATYRQDIDGYRQTRVEFSDRKGDASRRDFTINQIYFDLKTKEFIDQFGGVKDLNHKILRCVGSASKRFKEDQLRVYRAYRFANKYDLAFDAELKEAIENINFSFISRERITNELQKTFDKAGKIPFGNSVMQPIFDFIYDEKIAYNSGQNEDPFIDFILNLNDDVPVEKMKEYRFDRDFALICETIKNICLNNKTYIAKIIAQRTKNISKRNRNLLERFVQNKQFEETNPKEKKIIEDFLSFNPRIMDGTKLQEFGLFGKQIGEAIQSDIISKWEVHHGN